MSRTGPGYPSEIQTLLAGRPLPRPLADPLLAARPYFAVLALIVAVGFVRILLGGVSPAWVAGWGIATGLIMAAFLLALPRRPVQLLYMRAFQGDDSGFGARAVIESAFHPEARLAGIRPPRRRMGLVLRPLLLGVFIMRYAGGRYSNLEAGSDWLPRIWRALADVRAAVIDLRSMTALVAAEMRLAFRCVGPGRLLLVVDASRSRQEWDALVRENLSLKGDTQADFHFACWRGETDAQLGEFLREVERFKGALAPGVPGPAWHALPDLADQIAGRGAVLLERVLSTSLLALGVAAVIALNIPSPQWWSVAGASLQATPYLLVPLSAVGWYLILVAGYAAVSLFRRDPIPGLVRRKSRFLLLKNVRLGHVTLAVLSVVLALGTYGSVETLRTHAEDTRGKMARADLHGIRSALLMYQLSHGRWPEATSWAETLVQGGFLSASRPLKDPWDEDYVYRPAAPPQATPVVYSKGPDRIAGTADDIHSSR